MKTLFEDPDNNALFSDCRKYRYALWRIWDKSKPLVMFIGLNPSKADESKPDNTITKVTKIAKHNGYGGFYMMNCFPLVSTDPEPLRDFYDTPFHEKEDLENLRHLLETRRKCQDVVFAWGNFKVVEDRAKGVIKQFSNAKCLHVNKNGSPKHPLYCRDDSIFIDFK